jgi:hypothetical protein
MPGLGKAAETYRLAACAFQKEGIFAALDILLR